MHLIGSSFKRQRVDLACLHPTFFQGQGGSPSRGTALCGHRTSARSELTGSMAGAGGTLPVAVTDKAGDGLSYS